MGDIVERTRAVFPGERKVTSHVALERAIALLVLVGGCAPPSPRLTPARPMAPAADEGRARTTAFARVEDQAIDWLAAADPRLAKRADVTASDAVLKRVGLEGVLAEDTAAQIRGTSLDLFAFRARARALDQAAKTLAEDTDALPEAGPVGTTVARPKLERELLERLIAEERARADDESALGEACGDLVRGIVATWTPPGAPQDWPDRDAWVSKHLTEMRASLGDARPPQGPLDLDAALYPLERLLAPLQFPRGSAAIAEVRMALDRDMRAVPSINAPERVARAAKVHLGVTLDPPALRGRLERIEARLRQAAGEALRASGSNRPEIEARARDLLLVGRPCTPVADSRVRSMAPPPEREAICGALGALADEGTLPAALVALHDDVLLAFSAVVTSPPARSSLMSHAEDEDIAALQRTARERPIVAIGVALAAELLYGSDGGDERLRGWLALGEAPLDVVARELGAAGGTSSRVGGAR
jgi:hypothetical protein